MPKHVMRRRASDNVYLHKDFHGALSCAIQYLHENFGEAAVRQYLARFTRDWYAPLREDIRRRGLDALEDHFRGVFAKEGGGVRFHRTAVELVIYVDSCPAIRHMRERGMPVADLFFETTRTVNEGLCEGTDIEAELVSCACPEGRCIQRFRRKGGMT